MSAKAPAADAAAAAVPAAKSGLAAKLPMILIGLVVMANMGGTAIIALRLLKGGGAQGAGAKEGGKEEKVKEAGPGPVIALETFVVNLNEAASSRYLKTTFEIEVADVAAKNEVEEKRREMRDEILRYLSNLTVKDTLGDANKEKIKSDLLARADRSVGGSGKVRHLYFVDFVVQ